MAVHLTPLATTVEHAQQQGCWGGGWALESAAARVCREGGARARSNVFVHLDLLQHNVVDSRRLEVGADGLPFHGGAQLATDTTLVSPLQWDGRAIRGAAEKNGKALLNAKECTHNELDGEGSRARLVVLGHEVGGHWSEEKAEFLLICATFRRTPTRRSESVAPTLAKVGGKAFAMSLMGLVLMGQCEVICEARHA